MSPAGMIILRIFHILGGVFLVGVPMFNVLVLFPTMREAGPAGGQFAGRLLGPRFQRIIGIAGASVFLSGILMMWSISGHFAGAWFHSPFAMGISTGALLAVAGLGVGQGVAGRTAKKLGAIMAAGGPPSPETQAEIGRLQARLQGAAKIAATLFALAAVSMMAARYL